MVVKSFLRPEWSPVRRKGNVGVEGQVLLVDEHAVVATLRLSANAHTDAHPADCDIHVMCVEGSGFANSAGKTTAIQAGQSVLWPKGEPHNLYTENHTMMTLMVEHVFELGGGQHG